MSELLTRQPAVKFYGDLFETVKNDLPSSDARGDAIQAFLTQGMPHRRVEEWKYTDTNRISQTGYDLALDVSPVVGASDVDRAAGVVVDCLDEVSLPSVDQPFVLMNEGLWTGGAQVTAPAGYAAEQPVVILHSGQGGDKTIVQRNEFIVKAGSSLTVVETYEEGCAFSNHVTNIVVEENASLTHIRRQSEEAGVVQVLTQSVIIQTGGHYKAIVLSDGSDQSRSQTHVRFAGENASCEVQGATMAADRQALDQTFVIDHAVPNCTSNVSFRTILDEEAVGVFQAKTIVAKDAQHTDGRQMSKAILLSDRAAMNAKPELEIYADDVACAHGATSGELDEEQVFYLQSRGIPQAAARALLIKAFLSDVFDGIEDEDLRESFVGRVDAWLDARGTGKAGKEEAA